ncbi:MAG TPA: hypothetical protein VK986_07485 [Tepidisphaeraceae bacterium]|nr:hypothetical protein [Tepidisphaeraceae bacterium]
MVLLLAVGLLTTVYVREGLFNGGLAVVNVLLGAFWMIGLISGLVRDGVDARALPTLGVVALCAVNAVLLFRDSGR